MDNQRCLRRARASTTFLIVCHFAALEKMRGCDLAAVAMQAGICFAFILMLFAIEHAIDNALEPKSELQNG